LVTQQDDKKIWSSFDIATVLLLATRMCSVPQAEAFQQAQCSTLNHTTMCVFHTTHRYACVCSEQFLSSLL